MSNISEDQEKNQKTLLDESNDRQYFTIIPNILFELGLSAQEIAVYCFIKKVAGEKGSCFMGVRRICDTLKLSPNNLQKIKENLIQKKLISVEIKKKKEGGQHITRILDIWPENINYFKQKKSCYQSVTPCYQSVTPCYQQVTGGCYQSVTKEELSIKEEPFKKNTKYITSLPLLASFKKYLLLLNPNFKLPADNQALIDMDRIIRIDKRSPKQILEVIEWLKTSSFWSKNVLSVFKLRTQFERLLLEIKNSPSQAKEEKKQLKEDNQAFLKKFANVLCSNTNDPLVADGIKIEEHYFYDRSKSLTIKYSLSKAEIVEIIKQNYGTKRPYIMYFLTNI